MTSAEEAREHGDLQIRTSVPRPWAVTAVGLLLLLQAAGLAALGIIHFVLVYFAELPAPVVEWSAPLLLSVTTSRIYMSIISIQLAMLAIMAAIGFWRLWRNAWLTAMLLQGLCLLLALILYFHSRPALVYVMMFYGILMVLYLNTQDVRATFQSRSTVADGKDLVGGDA
ncbi:MAG: hypothetical protein KKA73_21370 [Chloroflexi bacterium]|nr:hypothetical protein [Chloroflexota bacterium]MBU1750244.1 hypothetical protein [Chloroflexota bacterium]